MKKIVGTIAAIALAASSAFAGVNVGMGFNRGFFVPFAYDGTDAKAGISTSWGAEPRVGVSFSAASEQVGVVADVKFDGGAVAVNDNAYIWVKPTSWFKMNIGQSFDDTLRGNACFGSWDWLRPGNILGEDLIFTRVCNNPVGGAYAPLQGAILMLDPIEGLHISVGIPTGYGFGTSTADKDSYGWKDSDEDPTTAPTWEITTKKGDKTPKGVFEDVWAKAQVQAGYTIADVAQIKAQWIGKGKNKDDELEGQIEVAASVKAIEGMTLDVGAKFRTWEGAPISVGVFWGMPVAGLALNANAEVSFSSNEVMGIDTSKTEVKIGAGVGYDLGNGMGVGADVRYAQAFSKVGDKSDSSDPAIAFAAWFDKGIANGTLGVAFQGATKTTICDVEASDFTFAVPVRVQCFF